MEANNQRRTRHIAKMIRRNISELRKSGADIGKEANEVFDMIDDLAKEALITPPRNCDVGSAKERMCRYNRVRDEINERYERLGEIPPSFAFPTVFEWEDSPYEAEERAVVQ